MKSLTFKMIRMNQSLILVIVLLAAKTSAATFPTPQDGAVLTFVDDDSNENDTVEEPCMFPL